MAEDPAKSVGNDTIPVYHPTETPVPTPKLPKSAQPKLANLVFAQHLQKKSGLSSEKKKLLRVANALILAKKLKPPPVQAPIREKIKEKLKEAPKGFCAKVGFYAKVFYKELGLKHLTLVLFIIIYAFIGGAIFSAIEKPNELREKAETTEKLQMEAANLTRRLTAIFANNSMTEADKILLANGQVVNYQKSAKLYPDLDKVTWDLWGGVFYSGTIFTTIGYGHYFTKTTWGRVATMIYALIGIPLLLATLNDLGKFFTRLLKKIWNKLMLIRNCRRAKKPDETAKQDGDKTSISSAELEEFDFPLPIAIGLIVVWILLCAKLFCLWETDWTYFESVYFFYISLTTIGLGDITPNHPKIMIVCFGLVIFGLTLVTMVINLIQSWLAKLKDKTTDLFEDEIGFDTDSDDEESKKDIGAAEEVEMDEDEYESFRANLGIFQVQSNKKVKRIRRGTQTTESNFTAKVEAEEKLAVAEPPALKFGQKWHKRHADK